MCSCDHIRDGVKVVEGQLVLLFRPSIPISCIIGRTNSAYLDVQIRHIPQNVQRIKRPAYACVTNGVSGNRVRLYDPSIFLSETCGGPAYADVCRIIVSGQDDAMLPSYQRQDYFVPNPHGKTSSY